MKRVCSFLLVLSMMMIPMLACTESIDLTGMSLDELVKLQERVTMAMWQTNEWQEVTVPAGLYTVGVEIPSGKWTITATPNAYMATVKVGTKLNSDGNSISYSGSESVYLYGTNNWAYNESKMNSWTVTLKDGMYISLEAAAVFTPYSGPSFSFK